VNKSCSCLIVRTLDKWLADIAVFHWSIQDLDLRCEQLIKEEFGVGCNFDVVDAVKKLEKLGIVSRVSWLQDITHKKIEGTVPLSGTCKVWVLKQFTSKVYYSYKNDPPRTQLEGSYVFHWSGRMRS
jgi:hypothetical protein